MPFNYLEFACPMGHHGLDMEKVAANQRYALELQLIATLAAPNSLTFVTRFLEIMHEMLDPLAIEKGLVGRYEWLHNVQKLPMMVKVRSSQGQLLTVSDRALIKGYTDYWRGLRGGPMDMSDPECQIILLSIAELLRY